MMVVLRSRDKSVEHTQQIEDLTLELLSLLPRRWWNHIQGADFVTFDTEQEVFCLIGSEEDPAATHLVYRNNIT